MQNINLNEKDIYEAEIISEDVIDTRNINYQLGKTEILSMISDLIKIKEYPVLLDIPNLAGYLGVTEANARLLMSDPYFPIIKQGNRKFAIRSKIQDFLEEFQGQQMLYVNRGSKRK